jgi:hypothetical protein
MAMKILAQNLTEILLGRSVGRPIVIRQIEVSHTSIESAANYRPARLEDIGASNVLPQPNGNRR